MYESSTSTLASSRNHQVGKPAVAAAVAASVAPVSVFGRHPPAATTTDRRPKHPGLTVRLSFYVSSHISLRLKARVNARVTDLDFHSAVVLRKSKSVTLAVVWPLIRDLRCLLSVTGLNVCLINITVTGHEPVISAW